MIQQELTRHLWNNVRKEAGSHSSGDPGFMNDERIAGGIPSALGTFD